MTQSTGKTVYIEYKCLYTLMRNITEYTKKKEKKGDHFCSLCISISEYLSLYIVYIVVISTGFTTATKKSYNIFNLFLYIIYKCRYSSYSLTSISQIRGNNIYFVFCCVFKFYVCSCV